jgi:hypothetical protein
MSQPCIFVAYVPNAAPAASSLSLAKLGPLSCADAILTARRGRIASQAKLASRKFIVEPFGLQESGLPYLRRVLEQDLGEALAAR